MTTILWYGLGPILMIPVWLIVLIRGRMPQPLYEAIAACLRYWARMKAYWYLLTDVYPDGLFGDPAELALSGPVAGWTGPAFSEAGHAVGWAGLVASGQEPPVASAVPTAPAADHPVLLPADYVAAGAAQTGPGVSAAAMATPGRLVLSRPGKRLVGLTLGIGAATPVALFALFFVAAAVLGAGTAATAATAGMLPGAAATPRRHRRGHPGTGAIQRAPAAQHRPVAEWAVVAEHALTRAMGLKAARY